MVDDYAQLFLERLDRCGWFDHVPAQVAQETRDRVGSQSLSGEQRGALISVPVDHRYLLSPHPYSALLRLFAEASCGALAPDEIAEEWKGEVRRFCLRVANRVYESDLPADADEPPPEFYAMVNRALADAGSPLRFLEITNLPWGPIQGFALTTPGAFSVAMAMNLVSGRIPEELMAEAGAEDVASTQARVRGEELYSWQVLGEAVGDLTVPGDFEATEPLERADLGVVLVYEKTGVIVLQWGEFSTPQALLRNALLLCDDPDAGKSSTRQGDDRTTVEGRTTVGGCAVRWRADEFTDVPVQLLVVVPDALFRGFSASLDSFHLTRPASELREAIAQRLTERQSKE